MGNVLELFKERREQDPQKQYLEWLKKMSTSTATYNEWKKGSMERVVGEANNPLEEYLAIMMIRTQRELDAFPYFDKSTVGTFGKSMLQYIKTGVISPYINYTDIAVQAMYIPFFQGSDKAPAFNMPCIEISRRYNEVIELPLQEDYAVASTMLTCARLQALSSL